MFHLTPQEKSALAVLLTIALVGTAVKAALNADARPFRWIRTSSHKIVRPPPDLNTSDASNLERLPGVGPKTAENIIEYRGRNGPFVSVYELRHVKGISRKNLRKIIDFYYPPEPVKP